MNINDLPPEVLISVLKPICEEKCFRTSYWKSRLSLLAVCRRWRQICLPMVYKTVSVDYIEKIRSNMDLMSDKMTKYSREANMWVHCKDGNTIDGLQSVLYKLQEKKELLFNISYFYVHVQFLDSDSENSSNHDSLIKMSKQLKNLLPNVSTLLCHINTVNANGLALETALVNEYAPQLERVEMDAAALDSEIGFTNPLSTLSLWWFPDFNSDANINVSHLTRLELAYVDESFDWSIFSENKTDNSDTLEFPALEYLQIGVQAEQEEIEDEENGETFLATIGPTNSFEYLLKVPQLKYLEMDLCLFTCSFIAAIPIHQKIKKLTLVSDDNTRIEFYDFCMSMSAKRVFEKYYDDDESDGTIDEIEFLNDLQNISGIAESGTHVRIGRELSSDDYQSISWPQVTNLNIDSTVSLTDLLLLARSNLADLDSLSVHSIKAETLEDGSVVIPELQDELNFTPIDCKLKSLEYGFGEDTKLTKELSKEINKFMYKIIPSLRYIALSNSS